MVVTDADGVRILGNMAWIIASMALVVFIIIPGVGYFYSGLLRRKNALWTSMLSSAAVSFQVPFVSYQQNVRTQLFASGFFGATL